jgi:DNA-binding XRE family transcriptional regulator
MHFKKKVCISPNFIYTCSVPKNSFIEAELAALAKRARLESGKSKAEVARELKASRPSVQQAEENPEQSLTKLRIRIIEHCSPYRVTGPFFLLKKK